MAIIGNIEISVFGTKVKLSNKYMRLTNCYLCNEYRITYIPQPPGADGKPNADKQELVKFVEVRGTLEIYPSPLDAGQGKPRDTVLEYTIPYNNTASAPLPEAQMYAHIMALPEVTNAVVG